MLPPTSLTIVRRALGIEDPALREHRVSALVEHVGSAGVLSIIIFGSVARGEADERSDLDVLIVVADNETRAAVLRSIREGPFRDLSPLVLTRAALMTGLPIRPSFVAHLLDEGVSVYETPAWRDIEASLAKSVGDVDTLAAEVQQRTKELEPLAHPERFANSPVTAMSHLYGVARALVTARLLQLGIHEYSWQRIFDRYAELHPELISDLDAVKALRPYYECARGRPGAEVPTRTVDPEDLRRLVASIERLAA
jgi:predicted nucleotidyltransferase